jgi:uncharacterized protein YbbC (DUF1343 family)
MSGESKLMHGKLALMGMAVALSACQSSQGVQPPRTRPGIDVLLTDSIHLVRGRRIGLVTNQAGIDAAGVPNVERLRSSGIDLVALFSPEHGFRGAAPPGARVDHGVDSATGLPIYSLYGVVSSPTAQMLSTIDVMVVDLQDAGARYYTYLATAVAVARAAGQEKIPVLVLDRPNPIGGRVQGNILDPAYASTVGLLRIPMRHGLTLGELVRLAQSDLGLDADITVVPLDGWDRSRYLDETGLPFVRPSPNLPTVESLIHYPGLCLFEGTALSVGRGSDAPFEQIGAPWLDTAAVLAAFGTPGIPGVAIQAVSFRPTGPGDGKFADTAIPGLRLRVLDRAAYDPVATAVTLLVAIARRHPEAIGWRESHFDRLAGGPGLRQAILAGGSPSEIMRDWPQELAAFRERVRPVVLYPLRPEP